MRHKGIKEPILCILTGVFFSPFWGSTSVCLHTLAFKNFFHTVHCSSTSPHYVSEMLCLCSHLFRDYLPKAQSTLIGQLARLKAETWYYVEPTFRSEYRRTVHCLRASQASSYTGVLQMCYMVMQISNRKKMDFRHGVSGR